MRHVSLKLKPATVALMKILTLAFALVSALLAAVLYFDYEAYTICDRGYTTCIRSARFKDLETCQRHATKEDWACNQTDPSNITCVANASILTVSLCN